ncbi:hypothetical protein EPN42_08535 [bacterium]|nr:MAG: hypothetical protein EPN42_08535 [bacterium]
MYCASCDSPDVRKLSLVYESGLTLVKTNTTGIGIGAGLGVGGASTRGTHVTALAAKAAPPKKQSAGVFLFLTVVCGALIFANHWWSVGALIFLIAYFNGREKFDKEYRARYAAWDAAYLCDRCGAIAPPRTLEASVIPNVTPLEGGHEALEGGT